MSLEKSAVNLPLYKWRLMIRRILDALQHCPTLPSQQSEDRECRLHVYQETLVLRQDGLCSHTWLLKIVAKGMRRYLQGRERARAKDELNTLEREARENSYHPLPEAKKKKKKESLDSERGAVHRERLAGDLPFVE